MDLNALSLEAARSFLFAGTRHAKTTEEKTEPQQQPQTPQQKTLPAVTLPEPITWDIKYPSTAMHRGVQEGILGAARILPGFTVATAKQRLESVKCIRLSFRDQKSGLPGVSASDTFTVRVTSVSWDSKTRSFTLETRITYRGPESLKLFTLKATLKGQFADFVVKA